MSDLACSDFQPEAGIVRRLDLDPAQVGVLPRADGAGAVVEHEIALAGLDHQHGMAFAGAGAGNRYPEGPRRPAHGDQALALDQRKVFAVAAGAGDLPDVAAVDCKAMRGGFAEDRGAERVGGRSGGRFSSGEFARS